RINVLNEMKEAHEGYLSSVRRVLDDRKRNSQLRQAINGVVAELMRVPKEYETAVETSLNTSLQNIVTNTEEDAKFVIEYLRRNNYGRATMLPVSVMRSRMLTKEEMDCCQTDGFIGIASDLIEFDEQYRGVFENLLGRTAIVKDIDTAILISRKASAGFRIATLQGDIIAPGGAMTGGSIQKREFTLLGREREINDLVSNSQRIKKQLDEDRKAIKNKRFETETANNKLEGMSDEYEKESLELAKREEKLEIINVYYDEKNAAIEKIELERSRINDDIADIDAQCALAKTEQETLSTANVATDDEIKQLHTELATLKNEYSAVNEEETACRLELVGIEKEFNNLESASVRLIKETENVQRILAEEKLRRKNQEDEIAVLNQQLKAMDIKLQTGQEDISLLNNAIAAKTKERENTVLKLTELRNKKDCITAEISARQERSHKVELAVTKLQLEIANLTDRIWEDYELTYENALAFKRDISVAIESAKVNEIRHEIRILGDVNVSSIEEYKSVKERFEALSIQYNDLTRAESDLRKLIDELMDAMKDEFTQKFELIQTNFTQVFAELFGGGHAELVLSDKNDILNCDIDIIARPPGKKLQLLSLLSGGERALTAIALLFAILKLKPTAFCILDEIESSLDEANVSNFARYIKHYSNDTQFILITHRKGSMEVCNALYGVAMEEKGISKIVSAKFNESEII
ncbi:MAG: AAA family ATPase, partial [Clostridia bacterium]|nr:AAA family ATPase [Clostridia bacterium]